MTELTHEVISAHRDFLDKGDTTILGQIALEQGEYQLNDGTILTVLSYDESLRKLVIQSQIFATKTNPSEERTLELSKKRTSGAVLTQSPTVIMIRRIGNA